MSASLLSPVTPPTIPVNLRLKSEVSSIAAAPRRVIDTMLKLWEPSFDKMWTTADGVTPAMRLEELGTRAKELFESNTAFVTFMVANLAGKDDELVSQIMAKVATIPPHTINEDGTVTLD